MQVLRFDTLDSTSLHARREIAAGRLRAHDGPVLFVATEQTGGIGRFGRGWASPRGGLWLTLAYPLASADELPDALGLRVGVACTEFVRSLVPSQARNRILLKWPNDVIIDDRKVLGVLCELIARPDNWLLVGAGLNANFLVRDLPLEIQPRATTLAQALDLKLDLETATSRLAGALITIIADPQSLAETVAATRPLLAGVNQLVPVSSPCGERVEATFRGIDDEGQALFEFDGARLRVNSAIIEAITPEPASTSDKKTTAEP